MSEPLGTCKYIDRQTMQKQMTWIPRAMAIPENAALHACGRKQGLKKAAWDCRKEVVPQKPPEGKEVITELFCQTLKIAIFICSYNWSCCSFQKCCWKLLKKCGNLLEDEKTHTLFLLFLCLSLMPLYLVNIAVYNEITHESVDSFVGDISLIKLLWTIMTKECDISSCFCSSQTEKFLGHIFFLSSKRIE